MNAIGYVRVSTEDQAENGVSLAAQEERVRAYCTAKGWEVLDVVVAAGQSAATLDRPGLQSILSQRDKTAAVVVLKLDRLTRSVVDLHALLAWFTRNEIALVAVEESLDTTTAAGRLMLNILTSVSQWEREAIGERTKMALRHLKANGRRYCNLPPYGYEYTAKGLVPEIVEQATIAEIRRLQDKYQMSLRALARYLGNRGIYARNGRLFAPQTLARILKREPC